MIFKRILAAFGHKNSKKYLYDYYKNRLSIAVVVETRALYTYQYTASSDAAEMAKKAEEYFIAKWGREELEKKVKQYG